MLKQTSLFLLLGALAVAPPAYAQSEGDADAEEGTEEEPEAPPEVPRVLKRAKKEFKKKKWALASIGFFSSIRKEDPYFTS